MNRVILLSGIKLARPEGCNVCSGWISALADDATTTSMTGITGQVNGWAVRE